MPNEKSKIAETALYDKLFREISPIFLTVFAEKVLGLDIVEYAELKDKLQMTRQKETDSLRKVTDRSGNTFILQLEIQKENEQGMAERMADYYLLLHRIHRLPIRQYVLYIGNGRADMPDRLELPGLSFHYTLMSFSELPYELFIQAEQPEVKMLAVLGNMGSADPYAVTESIVRDIDQRPTPVSEKYKRINQLRIIVQLRNFERQFQIAMSKAATFFKEERDPFYKRGEAKGIEKGIEKGMEKGIEKERAKAYTEKLNSARKMKESGFADQLIADILELPVETVHELK